MIKSSKLYLSKVKHVKGWFSTHDVALFEICLRLQASKKVEGSILEIGVFEGKSAILLGTHIGKQEELILCDTFGAVTDGLNQEENLRSYPNLSLSRFLENYSRFHLTAPRVFQCRSVELPALITNSNFRFIHIDGSHLYENVKFDLDFATRLLNKDHGFIVIDDFRAQHTFGVALAVWEMISQGEYIPILMTSSKIYLIHSDSKWTVEEFLASMTGIEYLYEYFGDKKFLRLLGATDANQYGSGRMIKQFLPPILVQLIQKCMKKAVE